MADSEATQNPLIDAFSETHDALFHGIKATNDRAHRLSTALIEGAQQGQREGLKLARTWAERPLDIPGFSALLFDTASRSQGRAFEFASQWVGELAGAQKEFGLAWQRVFTANRSATTATVETVRGLANRAREGLQSTRSSAVTGGGRGTGRETTQPLAKRPSNEPTD